jgi:uncharacterized protein (TIGR02118 family)
MNGVLSPKSQSVQSKENPMIKVNVMYPYTEGARFDHTYYRDRHMPMVKARLGSACATTPSKKAWPAERQVHRPPSWRCARSSVIRSKASAAMQEHGAEILGDIANYTDIAPVVQVSEVVVERSDR